MDIEVIKEIIGLFNQTGESAKELIILWLTLNYGAKFLFGVFWSVVAGFVIKCVVSLIKNHLASERLREAAGVRCCWNSNELEKACKVMREHYRNTV